MWTHLHQYGRSKRDAVVPQWFGATRWMKSGTEVPEIISNLNKNMLNIKWHIISPKAYWDNKREALQTRCVENGTTYKESMLEKLKDDILRGLSKVLSGIDNVGKFFHSESVLEVLELGRPQLSEWKIMAVDMKADDYIESQIKVGEKADSATTSGMGLHPSLSNILINGKLASGSEMLYAYKLFLATDTLLVDEMIFKPLNHVFKINKFKNSDKLKLGFYHGVIQREEDITPSNRVVNNNN